jgi:predicted transposase YbfD/YdcC
MTTARVAIKTYFRKLKDPRRRHGQHHRFLDIIVIAICAVIAGANTWTDIATFGRRRHDWLNRFLALPNGIPSHDTFERVFAHLDPQQFQVCFRAWMLALSGVLDIKHIAIDGKTLRGSGNAATGLGPLHVVSAWATQQHLSLGQVAVDEKSNEITAIPQLLELLDLHGALVTIDAMGCQKAIAQKIVEGGGDYLLVVKENQEHLLEDIQGCVSQALDYGQAGHEYQIYEKAEQGHGREEKRTYLVIPEPEGIRQRDQWPKLRVVGMCCSERTVQGETSTEVRYFIGSKKAGAGYYGRALRSHWQIENNLHWQMDIAFGEDHHRTQERRAAENLAFVRRIAVSLLKRHPSKESIRTKRLQAGWDNDFLAEVIQGAANSENL